MFFNTTKYRESRLEPIQIKYSPKEHRQKTPDGQGQSRMFNSTQFGTRKRSNDKQVARPRSSMNMIPRAAFLKPTFALQYVFFCENGNNGALVRRVMQSRGWFTEQQTNFNVNLIWKQSNKGFNYSSMNNQQKKVCINHLENHHEISNKNNLYENMRIHCQRSKLNIDEFIPATYIINLDSNTLQSDLRKFVDYFIAIKREGQQKNVWLLKPPDMNRGRGIQLFSDLKVFISQVDDFCRQKSTNFLSRQKQALPGKNCKTITITYPDVNESTLLSKLESGQTTVSFSIDPSTSQDRVIVLQKYLETPFLYNGRKFDFRVWILIDHQMKYYFFQQGYLRLASEYFDLHNLRNLYVHLTNNAVQKNHPNYGKMELGNQLSFSDLQNYFTMQKNSKINIIHVISRMKELVHQTIACAGSRLRESGKRDYQFEIFGYDFMVDKNANLWLIEVNTNPCLEESSPLLQKLIPRMLNDAFRLTVDKIFSPFKNNSMQDNYLSNLGEFQLPGFNDKDNLWEYLGQIK